jgi:Domain of unknown function (DUF4160)
MPVVFRYKGVRIFFFSNEGLPREPIHVHLQQARNLAKIWLYPETAVAENHGFSSSELKELLLVVDENRELIERAWNEHFG